MRYLAFQFTRQQHAGSGTEPTSTYTYDAFGAVRSSSGASAQPFRYTGEQWDSDSAFYYLRARYYDPAIGRFVTQDPWPGRSHRHFGSTTRQGSFRPVLLALVSHATVC